MEEGGLISCEECIKSEENNLGWYVANQSDKLLVGVKVSGVIDTENCISKDEYKKKRIEEKENSWKEKPMYGQFIRDMKEGVDKPGTWEWMRKADLKVGTEALICAAQEQALRTNYVKFRIDKTADSPLCRLCGEKGESISHIVSECSKLAQREYKRRHDNIARIVHWKLCGEYHLDRAGKWYEHQPNAVEENEDVKLLWDFTIQCDHMIEARRPDIIIVKKKERHCSIIDIAAPGDNRVCEKEQEKIEKYQDLKREISRIWKMKKVEVIPVIIGALGTITKKMKGWLEKIGIEIRTELLQKTALLGTARILRKVMEM